jgi:hypothetical protein
MRSNVECCRHLPEGSAAHLSCRIVLTLATLGVSRLATRAPSAARPRQIAVEPVVCRQQEHARLSGAGPHAGQARLRLAPLRRRDAVRGTGAAAKHLTRQP